MIRIREVSRIWFEAKVRVRHPHMTSLCRSVYRGVGWRASGGGRFHCDDNIALGGIGEAEMQISWRTGSPRFHLWTTNLVTAPRKHHSILLHSSACPNAIDNFSQFFSSVKHSSYESYIYKYIYLISQILFVSSKIKKLRLELIFVESLQSRTRSNKICNFLLFQGTASFKSPRQRFIVSTDSAHYSNVSRSPFSQFHSLSSRINYITLQIVTISREIIKSRPVVESLLANNGPIVSISRRSTPMRAYA